MVILNMFGKIEPICISQKMKIYISNLPNGNENNWNSYIVDEFKHALNTQDLACRTVGIENKQNLKLMYEQRVEDGNSKDYEDEDTLIQEIVDNMICIYLDYSYDDMPMGGWDKNPFDGRICEKDYTENIMDFLDFMTYGTDVQMPMWIYSSNYDREWPYYRMFFGKGNLDEQIGILKTWGKKLDSFLLDRNDYLQLDYIARALHDVEQYDTYHFFKLFSLCQMFLENKKESELDYKLPQFIDQRFAEEQRNKIAVVLRQMRNKIAHGDFVAFEQKAEEYAQIAMDENYSFDYMEYSRKNWVLLNSCCMLSDAVRKMIEMLFDNREAMEAIKKQ